MEERWRGVAPRYTLSSPVDPGVGMRGSRLCEINGAGRRGMRRGFRAVRRSVAEIRKEQKSVLSNRGARAAVPGFGSPVARFASLPWGCPILSHSGQTASFQHTQALSSVFASNFLSSFPGLAIEERWRGVAPRYALPLARSIRGRGMRGSRLCEINGAGCAGYDGVPRRAAGVWRRFARNKKCPEQPGRPGRLPGFGFPVARPACLPLALHPQSLRTSGIIQRAQALSSTEKHR